MRKLLLLVIVLLIIVYGKAQNPFAEYGYTPKIATLSQGQYNEFFDNDTLVQIGSVLFNTKSKQIVAFIETDTLYSEATLEPDIVSRWISPDPMSEERSWISPYNYCQNNPIIRIDEDGCLDTDFGIDENGKIKQIGPTNNEPDKLYATNRKGDKTDANGDKKVDDKDAVTVTDKSLLPGLSKTDGSGISKASTTNGNDAGNVFKFASDHSKVEWTGVKYSGDKGSSKYMIATSHEDGSSPTPYGLGISGSKVQSYIHSHPGIANSEVAELFSMGDNGTKRPFLYDSDWSYSINRYYGNNNKEPYPSYNYFPTSGRRYYVSPYGIKVSKKSAQSLLKGQ